MAAFHAEQITYREKKKAAQKRKGEGRDEQVILVFLKTVICVVINRSSSLSNKSENLNPRRIKILICDNLNWHKIIFCWHGAENRLLV